MRVEIHRLKNLNRYVMVIGNNRGCEADEAGAVIWHNYWQWITDPERRLDEMMASDDVLEAEVK